MAASVYSTYHGSQTATLTTEHVLGTSAITVAGTYQLYVDVANLVDDEILTLRVYGKARTGDTERLMEVTRLAGVQAKLLLYSPIILSPHYIKFTLQQDGGTGRAFPWAVYIP